MNILEKSADDLAVFTRVANEIWIHIRAGDSKASNAKVRELERLVRKWDNEEVAAERLTALISDGSEAVRYAAAAHLINYSSNGLAITTLRRLASDSESLVGIAASAVLRVNQSQSR